MPFFNKNILPSVSYLTKKVDLMYERLRAVPKVTERRSMDDNRIIEALFARNETALTEISQKYSRLYKGIIKEMLSDECDVDECANDVLLAVWNTVPPNRPNSLPSYVCKIARHIGINRLKYNTRQKRNGVYTLVLSELEECLPDTKAEQSTSDGEISAVLNSFLQQLDPEAEILFVRRYIYLESVRDLALRFGISENRVSVKLYRARKKLKKLLIKEGIRI